MRRHHRLAMVIIAGFAGVAMAVAAPQETGAVSKPPSCASSCVENFFSNNECSAVDLTCTCENASVVGAVYCCIVNECSAADRKVAYQYMDRICSTVGVTMPEIKCGMVDGTGSSSSTGRFTFGTGQFSTALDAISSDMAWLSSRLGTTGREEPTTMATSTRRTGSEVGNDSGDTNTGGNGGSNSTPTGLGVGLGVGIPLTLGVLGYLAFLFYKARKGRKHGPGSSSEQVNYAGMPQGFATAVPREKAELAADAVRPKYELQGDDGPRGELPG